MDINLLLMLSKIMSLMVVPCTQEHHLLTSKVTNQQESRCENGAAIDESVKWRPKLCNKYAKQKLLFLLCAYRTSTDMPYFALSQQILEKF